MSSQDIETLLNIAMNLHQQGQLMQAKAVYEAILKIQPHHIDALHLLGLIANAQGHTETAIELISSSLQLYPHNTVAHTNLGLIFQNLQQFQRAIACYDRALAIDEQYVEALYNRANALLSLKQPAQAIEDYQKALAIQPHLAKLHANLGNALLELKHYEAALSSYDHALSLRPDYAEALSNRGIALQQLERFDEALASYHQALTVKPNYAKALYNRGNLYSLRRQFALAVQDYDSAIAIKPDYVKALANRGNTLQSLRRYHAAIKSYQQALALQTDLDFIFGNWLFMKMNLCDWQQFDVHLNRLTQGIARGEKITSPFTLQSLSNSASLQKQAAQIYAQTKYIAELPFTQKPTRQTKIKIGYFSSDFRQHPVSHLLIELFERHDRERFEVVAFSFHAATQKDDTRLRLEKIFDQFIDVSQQTDTQVVQLARQLELQIAIDLNGYTEGCRTAIFAMRVAPIQISYIGYLGTMGASYMDYLIADHVLIPATHRHYYTEKIIYLPHSFQANDSRLTIAKTTVTRSDMGLPELAFVFCCFNNHYKITPHLFACWMHILQQVPNSVLWLLGDNTEAQTNLCLTANQHGIAAERLIFAKRQTMPDYLAQHRLADLFLDTTPYNAGATASAALWAGLPIITYLGETFSARMAASLLTAIGLPELITTTLTDYQALAIQLANQPERLTAIRQKLAENRLNTPLFNTALLTRHLENAYQTLVERYQAGLAPDHIEVHALTSDAST